MDSASDETVGHMTDRAHEFNIRETKQLAKEKTTANLQHQ